MANSNEENRPLYYGRFPIGNNMENRQNYEYYLSDDDEDEKELQKIRIQIRKVLIPQIEYLVSYVFIPMFGAWIFKKLSYKQPALPSIVSPSFCLNCRLPVDQWKLPFVKT